MLDLQAVHATRLVKMVIFSYLFTGERATAYQGSLWQMPSRPKSSKHVEELIIEWIAWISFDFAWFLLIHILSTCTLQRFFQPFSVIFHSTQLQVMVGSPAQDLTICTFWIFLMSAVITACWRKSVNCVVPIPSWSRLPFLSIKPSFFGCDSLVSKVCLLQEYTRHKVCDIVRLCSTKTWIKHVFICFLSSCQSLRVAKALAAPFLAAIPPQQTILLLQGRRGWQPTTIYVCKPHFCVKIKISKLILP